VVIRSTNGGICYHAVKLRGILPHDNKISWAGFSKREKELSSYQTEHGAEVDFIVTSNGETLAIESKASRNVGRSDLRGLDSFAECYGKPHRSMVFYLGAERRKMERVKVLPWQVGLREIGL